MPVLPRLLDPYTPPLPAGAELSADPQEQSQDPSQSCAAAWPQGSWLPEHLVHVVILSAHGR